MPGAATEPQPATQGLAQTDTALSDDASARRTYRSQRRVDALRLVPVAGAVAFLLPLLASGGGTAALGLYLFLVWAGLIAVTAWLSRRVAKDPGAQAQRPRGAPQAGP